MNSAQKTAVITGIAPGFGEALAKQLAGAGYRIVGLARTDKAAVGVAGIVEAAGSAYRHIVCDVTDGGAMTAAVASIEDKDGPVHLLIHNAHQLLIRPFLETDPEDFERVWRVACLGGMHAARAVLPKMLERGSGAILFTGATASIRAGAKFSAFASAKFAQRALAQSLAREYGPKGIHVAHVIIDGLIWEPQTRDRFDPEEKNCINPDALARSYLHVIEQDPSAWTHEIDLRPCSENF